MVQVSEDKRFEAINNILLNDSSFKNPDFEPSEEIKQAYYEAKILVVGAGGLGCDILKCLALSGMKDIHVIDLDTVDLSNLNRQFLFRHTDIDKKKCEVAAEFINNRVQGVQVTPHFGRIQEKSQSWYKQFPVIIAGLDNIKARRWLNQLVHSMTTFDEDGIPDSYSVLIDGGTESFAGQARVIKPFQSSCYECTLSMLPKNTLAQSCTIANTPRQPEHCVQYIMEIQWNKTFPDRSYDTDSIEDMTWIYEQAEKRAEEYDIKGVTYNLTLGVVKNIIPSIASTNAIIAAACVNETIKALTGASESLNNY